MRFPQDNRRSLQQALIGFGEGFDAKPSAADDARQDPAVRGLTGGAGDQQDAATSAAVAARHGDRLRVR